MVHGEGAYFYRAIFTPRLQPQYPQSLWNDHLLLPVIWWRYTFEEFESFKRCGTPRTLMGSHAADGSEENFGRSAVMEGARLFRVDNMALVEEVMIAKL